MIVQCHMTRQKTYYQNQLYYGLIVEMMVYYIISKKMCCFLTVDLEEMNHFIVQKYWSKLCTVFKNNLLRNYV